MTAPDEAVLRNMGDEALNIVTTCWYSAELDAKPNQTFAPAFRKGRRRAGQHKGARRVEPGQLPRVRQQRRRHGRARGDWPRHAPVVVRPAVGDERRAPAARGPDLGRRRSG